MTDLHLIRATGSLIKKKENLLKESSFHFAVIHEWTVIVVVMSTKDADGGCLAAHESGKWFSLAMFIHKQKIPK